MQLLPGLTPQFDRGRQLRPPMTLIYHHQMIVYSKNCLHTAFWALILCAKIAESRDGIGYGTMSRIGISHGTKTMPLGAAVK
jgi:hypothetical protein